MFENGFPKHWSTLKKLIWLVGSGVAGGASAAIKTVSGAIVHITDALAKPAISLVCQINPVQSGTGDPSPDNVRPITGFTGLNLSHSGADTSNPTVMPITWQTEAGTVYGGSLDVTTGVLTVTYVVCDLGDFTWYYSSNQNVMYTSGIANYVKTPAAVTDVPDIICTALAPTASGAVKDSPAGIGIFTNGNVRAWYTGCSTTGADFKTAVTGWKLVYPLAQPQTYQLDTVTVNLLLGENDLWHDANGNTELTYYADGN